MFRVFRLVTWIALVLCGCGGGGRYGHAVHYAPLSAEADAAEGAREFDPIMVRRFPEQWRTEKAFLFGVVLSRAPGPDGATELMVSVRRLEARNLCDDQTDSDTCRVTVSDRDFGRVRALVKLGAEDDVGPTSVGVGSLLRLIGQVSEGTNTADGLITLRAGYYRHWPRGYFVTKAIASVYRQ